MLWKLAEILTLTIDVFHVKKFEQYCPDIIYQKEKDDELSDDDSDDENAEFHLEVNLKFQYYQNYSNSPIHPNPFQRAPQSRTSTAKKMTQNSRRGWSSSKRSSQTSEGNCGTSSIEIMSERKLKTSQFCLR